MGKLSGLRTKHPTAFPLLAASAGLMLAAALPACGGGGSDAPAAIPAQAVVVVPAPPPSILGKGLVGPIGGSLSGLHVADIIVVVTADQPFGGPQFWGIYGSNAADDFKPAGLLVSWNSPSVTPARLVGQAWSWGEGTWDWSKGGTLSLDLSVDSTGAWGSGTVTAAEGVSTLVASSTPVAGYRFVSPSPLGVVLGRWELLTSQNRTLSIDIAADGRINGTSGPCALVDSVISPIANAEGAYTIRMRFRAGNLACNEPHGASDGVYGVAVVYTMPGGKGTQLVLGAHNGWDPVYLAAAGKR